jgi:hypothetical protein
MLYRPFQDIEEGFFIFETKPFFPSGKYGLKNKMDT